VEATGLREQKKSATRSTIVEVANELFLREGFDDVTLERVGRACTLSVRTILRYFTSKEAVALAPERDGLEAFRRALPERDTDVISFWRVMVAMGSASTAPGPLKERLRMIFGHPALFAALLTVTYEYEDLLAEAILEETGGADPLGARLLATLLVAGNSATVRQWVAGEADLDAGALVRAVDYAARAFRPEGPTGAVWSRYPALVRTGGAG
jgi:AcrR family transcriptional regulator